MPDRELEMVVEPHVEPLASVLTATPALRAKLFANPTRAIGSNLPPAKYWEYGGRQLVGVAETVPMAS